jgi:hypothetical protein
MRLLIEHEAGHIVKCLYTCPKSALGQFEQEFVDHGYQTFVLRHGNDVIPADANTVLVANSAMIVAHREQLRSWCPLLAVLDEAAAFQDRDRGTHEGRSTPSTAPAELLMRYRSSWLCPARWRRRTTASFIHTCVRSRRRRSPTSAVGSCAGMFLRKSSACSARSASPATARFRSSTGRATQAN